MERDSIIYKLRRKGQILAYYMMPNELLAKMYSLVVLKKRVSLTHPQTFNEKIQWLKLYFYPNDPLAVQGADKYAVRSYVKSKGIGTKLVPLIGAWKNAKDICWDELPQKFVLKCNHGCAYNILCTDKSKFDVKAAIHQLNKWMKEDFGVYNIELHYSKIKPRMITCEEYLGESITDYKFFCFNGEPQYIYISRDLVHDRQAKIGFFNLKGERMPLVRDDYDSMDIESLPEFYDDMKRDAITLCRDFPFVRVDFFVANGTYYFAELTFTPSAGMMPFNPDKYDFEWGMRLNIEKLIQNNGK